MKAAISALATQMLIEAWEDETTEPDEQVIRTTPWQKYFDNGRWKFILENGLSISYSKKESTYYLESPIQTVKGYGD